MTSLAETRDDLQFIPGQHSAPGNFPWVVCSCCGADIRDNDEENVHFRKLPYPDDMGRGMCRSCGGDDRVEPDPTDEKAVRKRLGWASCAFYDARIESITPKLNEQNRARFMAMSYIDKVGIIQGLIEKGSII